MASSKRERSLEDEKRFSGKKPRADSDQPVEPPTPVITNHRVALNPADCDLDFDIEANGREGSALYEHGFSYCWSGARANIGITGGKYCFSCKVMASQPVTMDDTPLDEQHLCRVGISRGDDKVGSLGETAHSFGFGGTGKFSNSGKFSTYGEKFNIGDTILCAVDLESKPMASISFAKNGKWLGTAANFNAGPNGLAVKDSPIGELHWQSAVFPHVLLKNVEVQMRFSYEDGLAPQEGYRPWASAVEDGKALMGPSFSNVCDCELIMMVGLPASGKTTWAEKWVKEQPEKRYVLLGTNLAMDQMKVPGLLRKQNYGERFDRLMDRATAIFNTLLSRASKTPRNFIIDQTNVYKNARKRKLKPFADYQKIAVVVFPRPEELKLRSKKRVKEMGKEVPPEAVNDMIANFVLPKSKDMPCTDEYFDQVMYIELNMVDSQRCLDEMKASLQLRRSGSTYSHGSSVKSNSSNTVTSPAVQYPRESSIHVNSSTLGHYSQRISMSPLDNPTLRHQETLSGGQWQSSLPSQPGNDPSSVSSFPRDDFSHHHSYRGYEDRAPAPAGFPDPCRRNSTYGASGRSDYPLNSETINSLPSSNAIGNYQSGLLEQYARGPSTYNTSVGPPSATGGLQVDMHSPTQSRFLPATTIPNGSAHGNPDPRNSYGNQATNAPPYGGYPPRPRYY